MMSRNLLRQATRLAGPASRISSVSSELLALTTPTQEAAKDSLSAPITRPALPEVELEHLRGISREVEIT